MVGDREQEYQHRRREKSLDAAEVIALLICAVMIIAVLKFIFESYVAPLLK
jgi:hypothetical protein